MAHRKVSIIENAKALFNLEGLFNSHKSKVEKEISDIKSNIFFTVNEAHSFNLTPVIYLNSGWERSSSTKGNYAEGIAVKVTNDKYLVLIDGIVTLPTGLKDDEGKDLVVGEIYALSQTTVGGIHKDNYEAGPIQSLFKIVMENGVKKALIRLERPIIL